jgi:hypothetical protein
MEEIYYINLKPQTDLSHRIHKEGCPFIPEHGKRIFLGKFKSSFEAIEEGWKYFSNPGTCLFCSKENHENTRQESLSEIHSEIKLVQFEMITPSKESALVCAVN